jgi:hypothetical protein
MGLTIYYKLSVPQNLTVAVVRELVTRAALYAEKIGCVEVGKVERVTADTPFTALILRKGRAEDCCFGCVPAKRGWVAEVWPGEGCESATMGLCQYPRRIRHGAEGISTGFAGGWQLKGACKTQYAAEHGWEHFLLCHKRVVSVLEFWRELGVTVEVSDEGGYWQTRDEKELRHVLDLYDGLMAAVAGMAKDAAENAGKDYSVTSPIFARADFERLEAEGRRDFARHLA